jgi:biopolymer transport protein TolQ
LERLLIFLATTGNVTPFIGLFGTVWGIMDAFHSIGLTGSANLGAVAPGIAEALITTAAGLATAIPGVIAYNYFLNRVKGAATRMDLFALEFLGMAERVLTRPARP